MRNERTGSATRPSRPPAPALADIADWLGTHAVPLVTGEARTPVTGLTLSSQRVLPGDLYVALPGARAHGATYAGAALAAGAVAVLTDTGGAALLPIGVPTVVVDRLRALLGPLSAHVYGDPATSLTLIGVTGTQGKTTTTRLAESGLQAAGVRAAAVGTVGTRIDGVDVPTALTTPEAPDLHALFAVMVEREVRACAMEVSSHALVMGRVDGVVFDVATFLNLGRDHLDFHTDLEDYFAPRPRSSPPSGRGRGLVNLDDAHGRRLLEQATIPLRTFSATGAEADWRAVDVVASATARPSPCWVRTATSFEAGVPLPGDFNVANALAAIASGAEAGFDPAALASGIAASGGVPGRLEAIERGQDFAVVVDYAHKPDAVEATLRTLRPLTERRLIVVLGAGGDRDPGKRPLMGEIASRLADVLVVTDDNPRSEDPAAIRAALAGRRRRGRGPRWSSRGPARWPSATPSRGRTGRHRAGRRKGPRDRAGGRAGRSTRSTTAPWPREELEAR